jgi:recombination protein RecA
MIKKKKKKAVKPSTNLERIAKDFELWIPGQGQKREPKFYFSTGSTLLDLAIDSQGGRGVPSGIIIEISGKESTGKTVVGAGIGASCQHQGGVTVLYDVESTFNYERGKLYGLDLDSLLVPSDQPGTVEELFTQIHDILDGSDEPCYCFIIDSLAALETVEEVKAGYDAATYGAERAKKLSRILRSFPRLLVKKEATLVFINQIRDKIGVVFGNKVDTPGGHAVKFYASTRVMLHLEQKIKDNKKNVIGIEVLAKVIKNKVDRPFLEASFPIYFDFGIDDLESCVRFLRENTELMGKKGWFVFNNKDVSIKTQTIVQFLNTLETEGLDSEIYNLVKDEWRKMYAYDRGRKEKKI